MKVSRFIAVLASVILFACAAAFAAPQGPPMPQPGPEHQILKQDEGTWDATLEINVGPGAPAMTMKGVEVNTMGCGGLCSITEFKGEMMPGVMFDGHGLTTWDATKKRYVGTWTDSTSQGLTMGESTWDPATKTMSGWMEGPDMSGKLVKSRSVMEYRADGTRMMTSYAPGPDGKEMQAMKITYTRRK
jgi:hypothetical protein